VKKYKEWCVKTDFYIILNYLYTHGDGESENYSSVYTNIDFIGYIIDLSFLLGTVI
jgi:hypothetical protein